MNSNANQTVPQEDEHSTPHHHFINKVLDLFHISTRALSAFFKILKKHEIKKLDFIEEESKSNQFSVKVNETRPVSQFYFASSG